MVNPLLTLSVVVKDAIVHYRTPNWFSLIEVVVPHYFVVVLSTISDHYTLLSGVDVQSPFAGTLSF